MQEVKEIEEGLNQFTGTQQYYKHWTGMKYTDGVHYLAESCECFWLLDVVASYQPKFKNVQFQVWTLWVNEKNNGFVSMREDTDTPLLVNQKIPYTDFPLADIKLWLVDGVLMLPSEY